MTASQERLPDETVAHDFGLEVINGFERIDPTYIGRLTMHAESEGLTLDELRFGERPRTLEALDGFVRTDTLANPPVNRSEIALLPRQLCRLSIREYVRSTEEAPNQKDGIMQRYKRVAQDYASFYPQIMTAANLYSELDQPDALRPAIEDLVTVYGHAVTKLPRHQY